MFTVIRLSSEAPERGLWRMDKIVKALSSERIFSFLVQSTLFFTVLEIMVPLRVENTSISVFKFFFIGLIFSLVAVIWVDFEGSIKRFFSFIVSRIDAGILILIAFFAYVVFDLVNLFYAAYPDYAFTKYLVVWQMLLLVVALLYEVFRNREKSKAVFLRIQRNLAVTALFAAVLGIINYFLPFTETDYIRRISTLPDYNKYATTVLFGSVCLFFLLLNSELKPLKKWIFITAGGILTSGVIFLSSSRRSYVMLLAFSVLMVGYSLVRPFLKAKAQKPSVLLMRIGAVLLSVAVIYGGFTLFTGAFSSYSTEKYEIMKEKGELAQEENSTEEVFDTIVSGQASTKRELIWKVAFRELGTYNPLQWAVGKGASHDSDLYDIAQDEELLLSYRSLEVKRRHWMNPHNFLLSDLINGGIIKLSLSILLLGLLLFYTISQLRRNFASAFFLIFTTLIVLVNHFLSSPLGYLGDKLFYIAVCLLLIKLGIDRQEKKSQ